MGISGIGTVFGRQQCRLYGVITALHQDEIHGVAQFGRHIFKSFLVALPRFTSQKETAVRKARLSAPPQLKGGDFYGT
jgi:hypothetical protein